MTTVVTKPDDAALQSALAQAERLREHGDQDPLGHCLLYLAERTRALEAVAAAAEAYVRFGEDPLQHARLVKALERLEDYEHASTTEPGAPFGLD